jgi:hypothetical protein
MKRFSGQVLTAVAAFAVLALPVPGGCRGGAQNAAGYATPALAGRMGSTAEAVMEKRPRKSVATVYAVQGIPGVVIDLSVQEVCVIEGFTFGDEIGPLILLPGDHTITIRVADRRDPCGGDVVRFAKLPFEAGENASIVVHLTAEGKPTVSKFVNDLSDVGPGMARVIVHHAAAAQAVDVILRAIARNPESVRITDFANGAQKMTVVPAGRWLVSIAPAGSVRPAFGPVPVKLVPGVAYRVYAVGSLADGSLRFLTFGNRLAQPPAGAPGSSS